MYLKNLTYLKTPLFILLSLLGFSISFGQHLKQYRILSPDAEIPRYTNDQSLDLIEPEASPPSNRKTDATSLNLNYAKLIKFKSVLLHVHIQVKTCPR